MKDYLLFIMYQFNVAKPQHYFSISFVENQDYVKTFLSIFFIRTSLFNK